jgi:hypothetical protein
VAWILGIATAAVAQNVVSNAEFDNPVETDGWVPIYASEWTYAPNDANGCDLSGGGYGASTAIADPARPQYFYVYSPGCLAVSPGQAMYLDFQYLAPGVEAVRYLLLTYSSADCTTGQSGFYSPGQIGGVGQWTRASWSILNVFNAASVRLVFDAWNSTATSFSLVFDRVYLGATPRIYSDDFEGGTSACRWSASIL